MIRVPAPQHRLRQAEQRVVPAQAVGVARVRPEEGWGPAHAEPQIRARIAATRETGYAINPGLIVEGSWGMAAAVFDGNGAPAWALSLTGVETRFKPERRRELGDLLLHQAHLLSGALQT